MQLIWNYVLQKWNQMGIVSIWVPANFKVLKMATRFEMMLKARMQTEAAQTQNEGEMLQTIVARYNSYRANAAIRKWQISPDQYQAIWCIIVGLDEISRSLLRSHLDHNKWEESGFWHLYWKDFWCLLWGLFVFFSVA